MVVVSCVELNVHPMRRRFLVIVVVGLRKYDFLKCFYVVNSSRFFPPTEISCSYGSWNLPSGSEKGGGGRMREWATE